MGAGIVQFIILILLQALDFYQRLYPDGEKDFLASPGYQVKFCRRYGIRNLAISGEKVSADKKSS